MRLTAGDTYRVPEKCSADGIGIHRKTMLFNQLCLESTRPFRQQTVMSPCILPHS
jgi:hypothetical protein